VDYRVWDPASDRHLPEAYGLGKMSGKKVCKNALIQEMGLDPSLAERPLLGMISRLDRQKGLDLLMEILDEILGLDMGLVVLGAGDEGVQESLRQAAKRHPGRVGLKFGFDEPLAHRIMGGADIFLIPSRYEPCGLTQMYALKYGTVPLVRATGGLEDTITQYDPQTGEGNGFKFGPYDSKAFMSAIRQATLLFQNTRAWKQLITRGMKADFSWSRSAQTYLELYQTVVRAKNG
jgi:starch synthase